MADLIAGRYPIFEEEWALDGSPLPPFRRSMSRRDIVTNGTLTSATVYVVAVVCQPGDIIGAVNIAVNTATATPTHGWAALYTGVTAASTLIAQSADNTSGFTSTGAAQKFTLASTVLVGGSPSGVAQGAPSSAAPTTSGAPVVLGVALYNSGATGGKLDGMTGGSINGQVVATGQVPLIGSFSLAATATAPANLTGISSISGFLPYVCLSKS